MGLSHHYFNAQCLKKMKIVHLNCALMLTNVNYMKQTHPMLDRDNESVLSLWT